jgi:hypothetical protein
MRRFSSLVVLWIALAIPSSAKAQTSQDRLYTNLFFLATPLIVGNALTDVGIVASLAGGPYVRKGWSVTGLVLSGLNTTFATFFLMGAVDSRIYSGGSSSWVVASGVYLLYGLVSTGLSIYGITKAPPSVDRDDDEDDDDDDDEHHHRHRKHRHSHDDEEDDHKHDDEGHHHKGDNHTDAIRDFHVVPSMVMASQSAAAPGVVVSFRW